MAPATMSTTGLTPPRRRERRRLRLRFLDLAIPRTPDSPLPPAARGSTPNNQRAPRRYQTCCGWLSHQRGSSPSGGIHYGGGVNDPLLLSRYPRTVVTGTRWLRFGGRLRGVAVTSDREPTASAVTPHHNSVIVAMPGTSEVCVLEWGPTGTEALRVGIG